MSENDPQVTISIRDSRVSLHIQSADSREVRILRQRLVDAIEREILSYAPREWVSVSGFSDLERIRFSYSISRHQDIRPSDEECAEEDLGRD